MARRFYFRSGTHSNNANMPQTNQHTTFTPTSGKVVDAFTTTRQFQATAGAGPETSSLIASNAVTSQQTFYYHRFATIPLDLSGGVSANTWTYNFAAWVSNVAANFPVNGASQSVPINCYVWRPSTQTKIATILEGNSTANFTEPSAASVDKVMHGTFSGSAVTAGVSANGDVIIFEVWFRVTQTNGTSRNDYFIFDGSTVNTTANTTVTNHASFIETPENLIDYTPPPAYLDMTNASTKAINTKFIT
jgi:hypothetical protein